MTAQADRFREVFAYDPETGIVTRKIATAPMHKVGELVGHRHKRHGYMVAALDYKPYLLHRIIWAMMTGDFPAGDTDHINGCRTDNRWCNLRDVPRSANILNRQGRTRADNTSGATGVFPRENGKWRAMIGGSARRINLGTFDTKEEAIAARNAAYAAHWAAGLPKEAA